MGKSSIIYYTQIDRWWRELHNRLERYFKGQLMMLLERGHYDPSNHTDRNIYSQFLCLSQNSNCCGCYVLKGCLSEMMCWLLYQPGRVLQKLVGIHTYPCDASRNE